VLERSNLLVRSIPENEYGPALVERTEYVASILHMDVDLGEVSPEQPMHYRPMTMEQMMRNDPPNSNWLADLFDDAFLLDEPFRGDTITSFDGLVTVDFTVRETCDTLFDILINIRIIIYGFMTTSHPSQYLTTRISLLRGLHERLMNVSNALDRQYEI
jgi:hypothetical protein